MFATGLIGLMMYRRRVSRAYPIRQRERGLLTAAPLVAIGPRAGLAAFRAVDIQDANTLAVNRSCRHRSPTLGRRWSPRSRRTLPAS